MTSAVASRPIIVTGADQVFARTLWQLLRSAERADVHRNFFWLVYDLGLNLTTRDRLTRRFPWLTMRSFDFSNYPRHLALDKRNYAWKPVILSEVADEFDAPVLWLDSATIITSDMQEPLRIIKQYGLVTLKGQKALGEHCDPRVLEALGVPTELLHQPERAGGFVGLDPRHVVARDLIRNWARHALVESHIMPPDPIADHKPDQSVLTALLYGAEREGLIALNSDEIDIASGRPMRWVTTRNKVKPWVPRWADPLVRAYYYLWKSADQFYYRFWDWERRWIGGAERRYREHFTVSLQQGGKAPRAIVSPAGGYYADPFPLRMDKGLFLFVEEFLYSHARGRLVCLSLDEQLEIESAEVVLDQGWHLSFPYLFRHKGKLFMLPESYENRAVDLFALGASPQDWRLCRRLLYGIDAVDTVIFRHDGIWWLITSTLAEGSAQRHLEIYYAKDLLEGEFKPHPVNSERLYANAAYGTGRNAGTIVKTTAGWVRPMQNSPDYYGQGVKLMLITELTPERFAEEPFQGDMIYSDVVETLSPHHVACDDDLLAWDVRDRAR